ncbi:MAG: hypothetical protein J2P27_04390 [Actinobacteria bacterium]|nr:hypothetical protein [Actinomycetota bacterium]
MSTPESLERRIDELRVAIRRAVAAGDLARARELRAELQAAEQAWDNLLARLSGRVAAAQQPGALLPIREQVHQALTLLGVAASPRLIVAVHDAFSSGTLVAARLTSLRRDEERSFRSAPHARAYYLCAALTADLLAPARGLLAVSTWPLERRVIGPLSPRVDFLRAAIAVADSIMRFPDRGPQALALLRRFAVSIPGAEPGQGGGEPGRVVAAAQAELEVHLRPDQEHRHAAAERAQAELDDTGRLFGSRPRAGRPRGPGAGS